MTAATLQCGTAERVPSCKRRFGIAALRRELFVAMGDIVLHPFLPERQRLLHLCVLTPCGLISALGCSRMIFDSLVAITPTTAIPPGAINI